MATRKKKVEDTANDIPLATDAKAFAKKKNVWPKVTIGSHSTRTEYEDGRVEFVSDWEALQRDVRDAIASYESRVNCETATVPAKTTRKKSAKK